MVPCAPLPLLQFANQSQKLLQEATLTLISTPLPMRVALLSIQLQLLCLGLGRSGNLQYSLSGTCVCVLTQKVNWSSTHLPQQQQTS